MKPWPIKIFKWKYLNYSLNKFYSEISQKAKPVYADVVLDMQHIAVAIEYNLWMVLQSVNIFFNA